MKHVRHKFSASEYNNAIQDYEQNWQIMDQILYRLCSDHPSHAKLSSVTAKVVMIGRTYATGIERKVSTKGTQGSSISQVVALLFSHRKTVDQWLSSLGQVAAPLTTPHIQAILTVHGLILNLLQDLTIDHQSARSFVSKYLHFHNPLVPIYDSIAAGFLPKFVRIRRIQIPTAENVDPIYAEYVYRFIKFYEFAASESAMVTIRLLDYYLIWKKESDQAGLSASDVQIGSRVHIPSGGFVSS
jgi:hypothetical protein